MSELETLPGEGEREPEPDKYPRWDRPISEYSWRFWVLFSAGLVLIASSFAPGLMRLFLDTPADFPAGFFNHFALGDALVDPEEILPLGLPRDGILPIDDPAFLGVEEADGFLAPGEPVLGIVSGGEARAYPLRILTWHEIVNDTFGGVPIAVTYWPLAGSAMIFDRRVGEETLTFGTSGLYYRGGVLLYDRETDSLWAQLAAKAVAGPLAGEGLRWMFAERMTWAAWREAHPGSEVLSIHGDVPIDYRRNPYGGYEDTDEIPVPVPDERTDLGRKDRVAGVRVDGEAVAFWLGLLEQLPPEGANFEAAKRTVRVRYDAAARRIRIEDAATGEAIPHTEAYWFAWQAFYPETVLMDMLPG